MTPSVIVNAFRALQRELHYLAISISNLALQDHIYITCLHNVFNCSIRASEDGPLLYRVSTPENILGYGKTTLIKMQDGTEVEIGRIDHHKLLSDVVKVRAKRLKYREKSKNGPKVFTLSDNSTYHWTEDKESKKLRFVSSNPHDSELGSFNLKYSEQPVLHITLEGEPLAEEVFATFIYTFQARDIDNARRDRKTPIHPGLSLDDAMPFA